MMQSPSTMYTTAHQQLACLMELRQYQQQQQQSNYNNRPEISISPSYNNYNNSSSSNQSHINNRPPSKAFTIDAILGLHNNNNEQCRLKSSKSTSVSSQNTAGIVASFAAACRRNAVAVLGSTALQDSSKSDSISGKHHKQPGVSSGAGKSKRVRTIFTPEQLERLEAEFERQQYMVGPERLYLASALHLTEAQVKVWFQNRRIKWRKQHLEIQQQRLAALKQQQQQHMQMGQEEESMSDASSNSDNPD